MLHRTRTVLPTLRLLLIGLLAVALSGCTMLSEAVEESTDTTTTTRHSEPVEAIIVRVIDGDTLAVEPIEGVLAATNEDGTEHAVRLLGIDAPEMNYYSDEGPECGAEAATEQLESYVHEGMKVTLTFDTEADHVDAYDRSLAYVSLGPVADIGLDQVYEGYATAWYPDSEPTPERFEGYAHAQESAEAAQHGSWANCETLAR